jgi:glycosyltransferase involved in cell wall biosynthesis
LPPRVSVIIPTYNRAAQIGEAIRSVLAQNYPRVEILVADDGSTDGSADVVAEFGDEVRYISLPHSGQPAVTRNRGLVQAKGDFVAFLDSDDLFLPEKLTLQLASFEEYPEVGLVYSDGHYFRDDPAQPTGYVLDGMSTPSGDILPELLRGNFLASPVVLLRRSCLDVAGLFDEDPRLSVAEDYELWLRIAAHFPAVYAPGNVAAIRRHSGSASHDVASLRGCALLALGKLEQRNPDLRATYATALNEGYARNHGAIALAHLQQRQILSGLSHAFQALRFCLRTPGLGTKALLDWLRRRRARGTAAMP